MKSLSFFLCLILMSCSSTKKEQLIINEKIAQETSVSDGKSLGESVHEVIRSSKTLNEKQMEQLEALFAETRNKNKAFLEESFKIRSVLIKEMLAGGEAVRLKLLKKDLKRSESMRLKSTLAAIDQISKIIGKDPDGLKFAEQMMFMDRLR